MTVIVKVKNEDMAHVIADVAFKSLGAVFFQDNCKTHIYYFYPYSCDHEEIHFKLSDYMSRVIRPEIGHSEHVRLHKWFNANVEVYEDIHNLEIRRVCPDEMLFPIRKLIYEET